MPETEKNLSVRLIFNGSTVPCFIITFFVYIPSFDTLFLACVYRERKKGKVVPMHALKKYSVSSSIHS